MAIKISGNTGTNVAGGIVVINGVDMNQRHSQDQAEIARLTKERDSLQAEVGRWKAAFWAADNFAVAIHDADGKCYSVRAQDYHRMDDLYHGRTDPLASNAKRKEGR